jgi:UDP-glucose 4-epimerase
MTSLQDARVLVTGGAGLVGSTITDTLLAEEGVAEVVVLDDFTRGTPQNLSQALRTDRVTVIKGDIRDRPTVVDAMAGIDVVFHQAAIRITQCAEDPRLAVEVLVDGTYNVIEAATAAGVRRLVAASSASVYGQAEVLPTTERHHPWDNDTIYGAAKVFNEGMLRSFHRTRGLDYVALRYFNVYGPRMDIFGVYTEVLVRWMERIEQGEPPLIHGDGSQTMDFVFITDIARANICAARAEVTDEVYNVGTGTSTSLRQLAEALSWVMGSDLAPEFGPERNLVSVHSRRADVSKATRELGFTATVSLEDGLAQLVDWWRAARAGEST